MCKIETLTTTRRCFIQGWERKKYGYSAGVQDVDGQIAVQCPGCESVDLPMGFDCHGQVNKPGLQKFIFDSKSKECNLFFVSDGLSKAVYKGCILVKNMA